MSRHQVTFSGIVLFAAVSLLLTGCELPPQETEQLGFRGVGMELVVAPETAADKRAANQVPEPIPPAPAGGPKARDVYQNVQVLGDLSVGQFTRLMTAITAWVSPEQGCNYCHLAENLASDAVYTKVVSRRMIQMTQHINGEWQNHVARTGVTCYTCHRGQPVPAHQWFENEGPVMAGGYAASRMGQNLAGDQVALASLPNDPFTMFLLGDGPIRVAGDQALPHGNDTTIQATEHTYALMMHMSDSLGVNCTYCHNSRAWSSWEQSMPARVPAWHGIRMARSLNNEYLAPLQPVYPDNRLGPGGDAPKLNCATCHNGVNKPLYGESMLKDYPSLAGKR